MIEAIARDFAMSYEHSRGRTPAVVSRDGEHYDVRSEGLTGGKRHIEAKGRAGCGSVVLTGPELDRLGQLGQRAWIYVGACRKTERPRPRIVQDPVSKLPPELLYRQLQYLVEESDWTGHGGEVDPPPDTGVRRG